MIRKIIPAIFMVFMSGIPLHAQGSQSTSTGDDVTAPAQVSEQVNCPNNHQIDMLCSLIHNKLEESDLKSPHLFRYQTVIMKAACTNPDVDSPAEVRRKIQAFWRRYSDELVCDSLSFTVQKGNIIKFAVDRRFDEFLADVVDWQIDLNRIDPGDNRTVLDFIKHEEQRFKGTVIEAKMKTYYRRLRQAGAKHRSELE